MKWCVECKQNKPVSEFSWRNKQKGTYQDLCKKCASARTLNWWQNNRDEINQRRRARYDPRKNKAMMLKKYGITLEDYERLWKEQDGKCPICGVALDSVWQVDIDHDHKTNKVRGILCNPCNLMIGHAKDNTEVMQSGIAYLVRHE